MDRDFLIQITNNLYRLTLFFPKKEPLRYKMREVADDILIIINNNNQQTAKNLLLNNLKILYDFLEIAKAQYWVSIADISVVQDAYFYLMEELEKTESHSGVRPRSAESSAGSDPAEVEISERQKKILEFIKNQGKVQVRQVQQIFPQLTKRTLRRDFEQMLNLGLIERIGENSNISYQAKN